MFAPGFDTVLIENHLEDNWVQIPRRYSLDAENVWMSESVLILSITLVAIALGSISTLRKTPQFTAAMQCILASSFITTLLLYILIPQFAYDFSSIFCQFSLLYAIAAILIVKADFCHPQM